MRSQPIAATSSGRCGADCTASTMVTAPAALPAATMRATSLTVPKMLLAWLQATSRVRGLTSSSSCS
ncbi:MAG: hypothetical protein WA975_12170 [Mesorhizobium sp.]